MSETIAAIASAPGAADRAIVRISGARAGRVVRSVVRFEQDGRDASALSEDDRCALVVRLPVEDDGVVGSLPALLLWMPGPRSFTVEDVAELHVLGHPEVARLALEAVLRAGARLAEPGEFTRRAFENGRIDLTRAEGVAALIAARSDDERRAAIALLSGGLERRIETIRKSLEAARALAEASLDFDEADTGHVPDEEIRALGVRAGLDLEDALGWERSRAARSSVPRVVLAGAPNAGKSTLFNALGRGELFEAGGPALVSDVAGTTRDARRARWELGPGREVELIDTAGRPQRDDLGAWVSREAGGWARIERAADELAARAIESADVVVLVVDGTRTGRTPWSAVVPGELEAKGRVLVALTKRDLGEPRGALDELEESGLPRCSISAVTGEGREELERLVAGMLGYGRSERGGPGSDESETAGVTGLGARHMAALLEARSSLAAGLHAADSGVPLDLVAEDLRAATSALDGIVGRTTPEHLLSQIFARFCLGK